MYCPGKEECRIMPENAGNPNILLVDNDRIVIEALADLFKRILPAVNIADSATAALRL